MSRPWLALVAVLFCLPLFVGLGRADLRGDEAAHSFSVERILEGAGWLAPKASPSEDAVFLEKPPLKFWIVAAAIRAGIVPHDEFGLRFWDALFASMAFLYVFAIGSRLAGSLCGSVAVLILFLHYPLLFSHGLRGNNMEAPLLLCYCGGVYHFMEWVRRQPDRAADDGAGLSGPGWRVAMHAFAVTLYFVLGFMTKFVAAIFLPMVIGATALMFRDWRTKVLRGWRVWLGAIAFALALILPWFVYAQLKFGPWLFRIMLSTHVYERFTSYLDPAHVQPWPFYFQSMYQWFAQSQTAVIVIVGFGLLTFQTVRRRWPEGALVLMWFALPVVLISFGTSKLYHYAYSFLPPVALAGGYVAGLAAMLAPAPLARGLEWLERYAEARTPRLIATLHRPAVRTACLVLAAVAVGVGIVGIVHGPIRLEIGGVPLMRSSGILRPAIAVVVFSVLAGAGRTASRAIVLLMVASQLPLPMYREVFGRLNEGTHPMRVARDCVLGVEAERAAAGSPSPGLYVDGLGEAGFGHEHYYYFRKLQPLEIAVKPSTTKLYEYLYGPNERPVLTLDSVYRDYQHGVGRPDTAVHQLNSVPLVSFTDVVLLLPGPYASCSSEAKGSEILRQ